MVTMLDCIQRVPVRLNIALDNNSASFDGLWSKYDASSIDEIVLIGSGTSYTSSFTGRYLAEKASGCRVSVFAPSEFLNALTYRSKSALYVVVSHSGTSGVTRDVLSHLQENGLMNAAISEAATTPIASQADAFIPMHCGHEEYGMRTIGYSTTVMAVMLLGMQLGFKKGNLSQADYDAYIAAGRAAVDHLPAVTDSALAWLDKSRRKMLTSDCLIFYGSGALYGVAQEAAVKVWETPQIISMGFELEEGLHGPNFGYSPTRQCVVVFNGGGVEGEKATNLGRFMKDVMNNGFIVGQGAQDKFDLPFEPVGGDMMCLEFAAVAQVCAYRLAVDQGRDLFEPHDWRVMNSYFRPHFKKDS